MTVVEEKVTITSASLPTFRPFIGFMDRISATPQDRLRKAIDDGIKVSEQVTQELKYRRNALAPISRLPPETLTEIFSLLPFSASVYDVTHVCHRWREIAFSSPYLWNHINFTKLTLAGFADILARAKMLPLHLEAKTTHWSITRFDAFGTQLEAHISRIRHISISGNFQTVLERLVSPAPALISLTLDYREPLYSQYIIPDSLFNGIAPKLTCLDLIGCSVGWKSSPCKPS